MRLWRTFPCWLLLALTVSAPEALSAAPFIYYRSILNAASFSPQGLPNGSIARGAIFTIFGRDLGPAAGMQASAFPLQNNLGGVSIEVCQDATCVQAIPLFVRADQINAIMPSNAPLGDVSIRVTFDGTPGNFSPATVVATSFGSFAINSAGYGPGVLQNFLPGALPINSRAELAKPGQTVILYGTGLGAALNADNVAPEDGDLPVPVEIWVGGKAVTVKRYSGRSPCCAGLDQIVFDLPADAPLGCYVPLAVRAGGVVSNHVTIAIGSDGAPSCSDPENPFQEAAAGGRVGVVLVSRVHTSVSAAFGIDFSADLTAALFQEEPSGPWSFNRFYALPPPGACTSYTLAGGKVPPERLALLAATGSALSPGAALTVAGRGGEELAEPAPGAGQAFGVVAGANLGIEPFTSLLFGDGAPTRVSAPGGADIGAFEVELTPPPRLTWTNRDAVETLRRGAPVEVSWAGGDQSGSVLIAAYVNHQLTRSAALLVCTERTAAGRFEIPGWVTATLPPGDPSGRFNGEMSVTALPAGATTFSASGLTTALGVFTDGQQRALYVE